MTTQGALAEMTVVDLSRLLPGPYCSMMLADHGARVIAVEAPHYKDERLTIAGVNRNKEHMSLNLKRSRGREIFFRLMESADVFIEGFRPGVVQRLGIDYESVRHVNAGVVYCAISGYGQTGPYRGRAGHDVNYLAESGVLDQVGEAGCPPVIPGVQIADIAGALTAANGILLALLARQRTGSGQYIDVSITDATASLMPLVLDQWRQSGRPPRRGDARLSHRYACYNIYETADGRFLTVGALEARFWRQLCRRLGVPQYAPLQYDETRRREVIEALAALFRQKTLSRWERELADLDVCCAGVRRLEELPRSPLFRDRNMVVDAPDPLRPPGVTLGVPLKLSETPGGLRTPPPAFGQHTAAILREIGYSRDEIDNFAAEGVT
jgi:crotonobetainyl-CoA:carnitine CoA-transferase CaiB-like acyl-CoA transferase